MTVVKAENAVKDYGLNGQTVHALRSASLDFQSGEFTAIAGPSGAPVAARSFIVSSMRFLLKCDISSKPFAPCESRRFLIVFAAAKARELWAPIIDQCAC